MGNQLDGYRLYVEAMKGGHAGIVYPGGVMRRRIGVATCLVGLAVGVGGIIVPGKVHGTSAWQAAEAEWHRRSADWGLVERGLDAGLRPTVELCGMIAGLSVCAGGLVMATKGPKGSRTRSTRR